MAKWYYHPFYVSEEAAPRGADGDISDIAFRNRLSAYSKKIDTGSYSDILFSGIGGCIGGTDKPLRVVKTRDVLTVDGHGGPSRRTGQMKIGVTLEGGKTSSLTPNGLAAKLKKDGLEDVNILIRLICCEGAGGKMTGDQAIMASVLAKALRYRNLVVEGYTGSVTISPEGVKNIDEHGEDERFQDAYKRRHYYDYLGNEISASRAKEITGIDIGRKLR